MLISFFLRKIIINSENFPQKKEKASNTVIYINLKTFTTTTEHDERTASSVMGAAPDPISAPNIETKTAGMLLLYVVLVNFP